MTAALPVQTVAPAIHWPPGRSPAETSVHVRNEITIPAAPAVVWAWLLRAELWPSWYPNASDIHFTSHTGPDLRDRSRFRWQTFGFHVTSKVLEFEPCTRLAWDAHGTGFTGWHAWLLTPVAGGTHVLTEETQTGWMARLGKVVMPRKMGKMHQVWLERLSRQAQTGMPG